MSEKIIPKKSAFFTRSAKILFTYFKNFFKARFWQNKLNLALILLSLFFNILIWVLLFFLIEPSEFPIPLHYNVYFGIDLTGSYRNIYHLPIIGLFIIFINFILGFWFYLRERIITYILLLTSLAVQIFVLIGAATVIFINRL